MLHVTQPTGEPALVAELLQREDQGGGAKAHVGEGQALEGKKVRKKFGRKFYSGTILAFEPDTKWYKVQYEDGDTEELEWPELEPILAPGDDKKSTRSRKRRGAGGSNQKSGNKSRKTTKEDAAVSADAPAAAIAAEPLDLNETVGVAEQEHGGDANHGVAEEHGGDADHAGGADGEDHGRSTDHGIAVQQEGGPDHDEHEQAPYGEVVEAEEGAVEDNEIEPEPEAEKKAETKKKGRGGKKKAVKRKGKSPNKRAKTATVVKEPTPEPVEVKSPSKRGKRKVEAPASTPVPKKVKETKQTPKATPSDKKSKKGKGKAAAKEKAAAKGKTVHDESMVEHSPFSPADRGTRLKGRKFKKDFDGKLYSGEIADYDRKTRFYKVHYEDGDEEELEWRELEPLLEPLDEAGTSEQQEQQEKQVQQKVVKPSRTVVVRKTKVVLEQRRVTRATLSSGRKSARQR